MDLKIFDNKCVRILTASGEVKYSGKDEVIREAKDLLERLAKQTFRNTVKDAYTG